MPDESGNVTVMTVFSMVVLCAALSLALDLSLGLAEKASVSNDLAAARDATMSADVLLVAKNADDPGAAIADAAVESLRENGRDGEVQVWFWEAPSSQMTTGKRAWAWAIQAQGSSPALFASVFGAEDLAVSDFVAAHAVPFTAGQAWRPASERMGVWTYAQGAGAGEASFEAAASSDAIPQEVKDELRDAIEESRAK